MKYYRYYTQLLCLVLAALLTSSCANLTPLEKSIETLIEEADQGDMAAAHALCYRFSHGVQAKQDDKKAFNWCTRASVAQEPKSMTLLADLYFQGRGVTQNYTKAARLYRFAADRGIDKAMFMLYQHYHHGYGVAKDETEARYYLNRAAQRNYPPALKMKQQILLNE